MDSGVVTERDLLTRAAGLAADYLETLDTRGVAPERTYGEMRAALDALNDVVLNQVLFRFADDATTRDALAAVQAGGEAWMSGTTSEDRAAIRLSVSSWRTTTEDVDRTVAAFARARA